MYSILAFGTDFVEIKHYMKSLKLIFYMILFQSEIAKLITLEQGKTLIDAEGDVLRGLRKYSQTYHLGAG